VSEPSDTTAPSETTSEATEGSQSRGLQQALTAERKRRQDLEQRLADIEKTQREAREADAKRRGEYEQLYQTASSEPTSRPARMAGSRSSPRRTEPAYPRCRSHSARLCQMA
jgi:hypothetical protein